MQSSPLYTSCSFFVPSNGHIDRRHEISTRNIFSYFPVDNFSELLLHLSILLIKDSRSAWIIDGVLSDCQSWLNSNILVSLEGITTPQKSSFPHTFSWDSSLLFVLNEWKQLKLFSLRLIYSFPVIFIYKRLNSFIFLANFLFLHNLMWLSQCIESVYHHHW